MYVSEINQPFAPLPLSALFLSVLNDKERIQVFLDKLLLMHNEDAKKNLPHGICSGAAVVAAKMLLEEDSQRGKLSLTSSRG